MNKNDIKSFFIVIILLFFVVFIIIVAYKIFVMSLEDLLKSCSKTFPEVIKFFKNH